jgi:hypothetical protein
MQMMLKMSNFEHFIYQLNRNDDETVVQYIDNDSTVKWLEDNIPLFECPDKEIEEVYYFR